jgi:hypothetical protein
MRALLSFDFVGLGVPGVLRRGQEVHRPVRILEAVVQIAHIGGDPDDFEIARVDHFV